MAYVIYQEGYVIYGYGQTKEEAINDASEWTDIDKDNLKETHEANHGDMVIEKITKKHLICLEAQSDVSEAFHCFCN